MFQEVVAIKHDLSPLGKKWNTRLVVCVVFFSRFTLDFRGKNQIGFSSLFCARVKLFKIIKKNVKGGKIVKGRKVTFFSPWE